MALAPLPTITTTPRYTSATLTAAVRVNIPFPIFGDGSDLLVVLNGVKQTSGWSLKSDSGSLATRPRPITDGYIEFTSSTTGLVQVWGRHVPRRTANLNESAGPSVRDFNLTALEDRALLSELFERLGRTVELPVGTTGLQLLTPADLALKAIGFDEDGNLDLKIVDQEGVDAALDSFQNALDAAEAAIIAAQSNIDTHEALTNNPHAVTKAQVGLGNADNTRDLDKPVSTATQAALDLKAPLASPTFTGVPAGPTASTGTNTTQFATTGFVQAQLAATYTAADVLTKIKTVDGSGSGLDADLVRGTTPSAFALTLLDDADANTARATLGTNNASNLNTGTFPDTVEPLRLRSAAGLTDTKDIARSGNYVVVDTTADRPPGTTFNLAYGTMTDDSVWGVAYFVDFFNQTTYRRAKESSTWQSYERIYQTAAELNARIVAGTNITKSFNGATGETTISATGTLGGSVASVDVTRTGTGNISSTSVEGALQELDNEKGGLALNNTWTGTNTFTGLCDHDGIIKQHVLSGLTGGTFTPFIDANIQESYTTASGRFIANALVAEKLTGGTGNRNTLYVTAGSAVNEPGKFIDAIAGISIARSGASGSFFGINGFSEIQAGALTSAECIGGEMNTCVKNASVLRKAALHLSDVDGSTGVGTVYDAALMILKSTDSVGYANGILISATGTPGNLGVKSTGKVLYCEPGTLADGIDLSAVTFTGNAFKSNAFAVDKDGKVSALGYRTRQGTGGGLQTNTFNIYWNGTEAELYIDGTRLGKINVTP